MMKQTFDPLAQRYPSQRYPIYARSGMVNCSSPLAAAAGLEILRKGGNAMDAAVAAAAALTVVEPTANGLGSDAFAIIWSEKEKKLTGLNSSGPSPQLATIERVLESGRAAEQVPGHGGTAARRMPRHGWIPVTVPGAPAAWAAVAERYGQLPLKELVQPAVHYARDGYPCAPNLAFHWQNAFAQYKQILKGEEFDQWFRTFAPAGRAPEAGELVVLPDHARTLEKIGETNAEDYYRGEPAERIDACSRKFGGFLRKEDLAAFYPQWVEPARLPYRGYEVCEIPPNGQGITALMALNILKEFSFAEKESVTTVHRQLEAMKMAFADRCTILRNHLKWNWTGTGCFFPNTGQPGPRRWESVRLFGRTRSRRRAERSICAVPTEKETWSPGSSPTTWVLDRELLWTGPGSLCRTGAPIFRWIRRTQTA